MSAKEKISRTNAAFMKVFAEGDSEKTSSLYTDDAWLMAPHIAVFKGKSAIHTALQGMFDGGITGIELETVELEVLGDTAIETGQFSLKAGDAFADRGKYMVVWKCLDGKWLLHRDMINSDMPMPV